MTDEQFRKLAIDVQDVLKKHQIDFIDFSMNVRVSEEYFNAIEDKQSSESAGDLFVRVHIIRDENRTITLTEYPEIIT